MCHCKYNLEIKRNALQKQTKSRANKFRMPPDQHKCLIKSWTNVHWGNPMKNMEYPKSAVLLERI